MALLLTVSTAACGQGPNPSPTTGASSSAAVEPSEGSAATAQPAGLEGFALVELTGPSPLESTVGLGFPGPDPLPAGSLLVEIEQDIAPDRLLVAGAEGPTGQLVGWIAAADDEDGPALSPAELTCPAGEVTVGILYRLGAAAALCAGGSSFEFDAFVPSSCGIADGPIIGEPSWLNPLGLNGGILLLAERAPAGLTGPPPGGWVFARVAPDVGLEKCDPTRNDRFYRITGHFDDPAAATCRVSWQEGERLAEEPPQISVARCRLALVITRAEPYGP